MDTLAYGWLSNCAIAPAIGALSVWILFMFNIYRSEWRNVDIFLVLITLQQLLSCSSIFAYSLVNIIRSRVETSCNLTVWSLTTLRIFQLSTIGSLAMDRALTLKWPYKYRFSVRSNQICYHVVVLALMSGLVGVADAVNNAIQSYSIFSWNLDHPNELSKQPCMQFKSTFMGHSCNRDTNDSTRSTPKSKMLPNSRISSFGDLAIENLGSNDNITNSKYHSPSSMGSGGGSGGNEGVGVGVGVVSVNGGATGTGSHNSLQRFYSISKEESI
uniref:G-protein coupled receptors family 1 profile domain-containing protein n=1 Tax=Tetranychus urticae TaxID=32264 RepID=T1JYT0_TETUR